MIYSGSPNSSGGVGGVEATALGLDPEFVLGAGEEATVLGLDPECVLARPPMFLHFVLFLCWL
jgi:hypothetical protein